MGEKREDFHRRNVCESKGVEGGDKGWKSCQTTMANVTPRDGEGKTSGGNILDMVLSQEGQHGQQGILELKSTITV